MKIVIRMQQESTDEHVAEKVTRRARFVLSRFGSSIQCLQISFSDINGPRGGVDTRCMVSVKLSTSSEIIVQGEAENIFSALNYCLARMERAVSRKLEKHRDTPIRMGRRIKALEEESYVPEK